MKVAVILLAVLLKLDLSSSSNADITIINGPQDTIVCTNATAECDCGFIGADPNFVIPNWRIILRNEDNHIISNVTYNRDKIVKGDINGLQWVPDLTSGDNNASNSKLLVGPVNMTYNQLSCQCIIEIINDTIISSVGTITVVDPLSVTINVDEICITLFTVSLSTYNHSVCGNVSYDVTVSGNVTYPDNSSGSKYTIDELQSNTQFNIVVMSRYNNGFRIYNESVKTSLPKAPNPINATSIKIEKIDNNDLRITWKKPEIDKCSMLPLKYYYVEIVSSEGEIVLERNVNETAVTVVFQHLDYSPRITFIVNISVIDIEEQRSNSTVTMKTIEFEVNGNSTESDESNDGSISVTVIVSIVVAIAVIVIVTVVIVIIYLKHFEPSSSVDNFVSST